MTALKIIVIACVLLIAWRRQQLGGYDLVRTIAIAWLVFFVLSPAIAPQCMVWLAPFVMVLTPQWIGPAVLLTSSLFLFCFYNVTSKGLPWYIAISPPDTNQTILPWSLCLGLL